MNPKSVVFIEPAGRVSNVYETFMRLPLMGSLYLGTILSNKGYDVKILNENILAKEIDPFEYPADVFCVTALTVSANRAKLLASQIRKTYPNARLIVGGIHASLVPEDFESIADHIVLGEAEDIIEDVILGKYKEQIVHGTQPADLDQLPVVDYGLLANSSSIVTIPIMTSRGCPFDCGFCTVTKIFGKKFRMQSVDRVIREMENALTYFHTREFFFYDDNFTANRRRMMELCDKIIEKKMNVTWSAQVRTDLARDPALVKKMEEAGLRRVYIGFESIDDATLKAMHKSQTRSDIEKAIRVFHDYDVNIHGMFIFGEDTDTAKSMSATADFAIQNRINTVQFMVLTPFPGTQVYDRIESEGRLYHKNWDYYNGMFIVYRPRCMSASKLLDETHRAYNRFYSVRRTLVDTLDLVLHIFLDALLWNFRNSSRYSFHAMFIRLGAKAIIWKFSQLYRGYKEYIDGIERREARIE